MYDLKKIEEKLQELEEMYKPIQEEIEQAENRKRELQNDILDMIQKIKRDLAEHEMKHIGPETTREVQRLIKLCDKEEPNINRQVK